MIFLVQYHGLTQGARSPVQGGFYGETLALSDEPVEKCDGKCKAPGPKQTLKFIFPFPPLSSVTFLCSSSTTA